MNSTSLGPRRGAALLASRPLTAHAVHVALHRAVREGELRAEGPVAALRALARRTHPGALPRGPRWEDVVDAAHGALAVGRTARRPRYVDSYGLALLMQARNGADHREIVRAPPKHGLAPVVPDVHVDRVLARAEARHRGIAITSTDVTSSGARRPQGEHDLEVRGRAIRHDGLVVGSARREGELLAPDRDRLGLRVVRVLVEQARVRPGGLPGDRRRERLLVVAPGSRARARRTDRRYRDRHRDHHPRPPDHTAVLPRNAVLYASVRCRSARPRIG